MRSRLAMSIAVILVGATGAFAQSGQTVTGTVTDSMCGAHHMMQGKTAAECTRECVKQGSDYALASGDKVYTLKGDKTKFNSLAGQKVTVKGALSGNTITVSSIIAAK
jgi:hypothetical protein